ncbi:hypothetical protein IWW36_003333 [Coemansia brasiliensis]|uniref:Uncharacterized protein n=1 Tax=Coemansia brasiliensis TaxID=2650707 RepID=A0A9W8IAD1_9FUNG|nr:hypothetical protein IWW36_003333 [Coemansia brasiliensis]
MSYGQGGYYNNDQYGGGYPSQGNYPGYDNQGGYQAPGYQAPGYGNQGESYGNQGQSYGGGQAARGLEGVDPNMFNEYDSINDMVAKMLNDPSLSSSLPPIEAHETSAREIGDFDFDNFANEFGSEDGERGLFGFSAGHGKSKTSHQLIGGAAAWAAFKWYENWKLNTKGEKVNHSFIKKVLTAFAAAQAIKFAEQRSSSFQGGLTRDVAIREATQYAGRVADVKYQTYENVDYTVQGGQADSYDAQFDSSNQQSYGQAPYGGYNQQPYGGY